MQPENPIRGERCAHQSCGCMASREHEGFCSLYCANAEHGAPPEGACSCNHAACQQPPADSPDDEVQTALGSRPDR